MTLDERLILMGRMGRAASSALRATTADQRAGAIRSAARLIRAGQEDILAANRLDLESAGANHDRLSLDPSRIEGIAVSLETIAELPDPVDQEMDRWTRPNGLDIARVRTPIGVIGMIYESRPNVTADAAAICLKSANAVILRSGSDALRSSVAIYRALLPALTEHGIPEAAVQLIDTADRRAVGLLLDGLDGSIDLLIPRGGRTLVERVQAEARVPTLGHLEGLCHSYVHEGADIDMGLSILRNAKLRRVAVCGSTETLLVDRAIAASFLPRLAAALPECELRGCPEAVRSVDMQAATEEDWSCEYLAPILSIRVVAGLDEALAHIARYGTGHTEAIITADAAVAEIFLASVDSSIVIWNASTQFADGGEFGFGGEIGIATGKLHARGPIGPEQLTSYNYRIRAQGQIRQ